MAEPVRLTREDFLDEIRIAPKWDIFPYYQEGFFQLVVYYSFGVWTYRSPAITDMVESESKYFYRALSEIMIIPSIAEAKVQ